MQITIKTTNSLKNEFFIYNYLKNKPYQIFLKNVDLNRLRAFDREFNINSFNILRIALTNLLITKNGNSEYSIKINKVIKVQGKDLDYWINLITYGNRTIKGYTILLKIFDYISNNIGLIYKEWEDGH